MQLVLQISQCYMGKDTELKLKNQELTEYRLTPTGGKGSRHSLSSHPVSMHTHPKTSKGQQQWQESNSLLMGQNLVKSLVDLPPSALASCYEGYSRTYLIKKPSSGEMVAISIASNSGIEGHSFLQGGVLPVSSGE